MEITIHFDIRDQEYGVTLLRGSQATHLSDLAAFNPLALDVGPLNPEQVAQVIDAGELAYAGNNGRFDPPTFDAIAAAKGFGTVGTL